MIPTAAPRRPDFRDRLLRAVDDHIAQQMTGLVVMLTNKRISHHGQPGGPDIGYDAELAKDATVNCQHMLAVRRVMRSTINTVFPNDDAHGGGKIAISDGPGT